MDTASGKENCHMGFITKVAVEMDIIGWEGLQKVEGTQRGKRELKERACLMQNVSLQFREWLEG